jgi:hypothetical protein
VKPAKPPAHAEKKYGDAREELDAPGDDAAADSAATVLAAGVAQLRLRFHIGGVKVFRGTQGSSEHPRAQVELRGAATEIRYISTIQTASFMTGRGKELLARSCVHLCVSAKRGKTQLHAWPT